jgi:hypothetical protein
MVYVVIVILVPVGEVGFLMPVEAASLLTVQVGQAGDLGRGEHRRDEDRREDPAPGAELAFSYRSDHCAVFRLAVMSSLRSSSRCRRHSSIRTAVARRLTRKYMS